MLKQNPSTWQSNKKTCYLLLTDMDLASKFKDAANCVLIRIEQMIQNEDYTIVRVVKLTPSGHVIFFIRKVHDAVKLYKKFNLFNKQT